MRSGLIPCYVINLRRSTQRKEWMERQLGEQGIKPIFIDAVDGDTLSDIELTKHLNSQLLKEEWPTLTKREAGCALSHIKAYTDIVRNGYSAAVILEDDVRLTEDFCELLNPLSDICVGSRLSSGRPEMMHLSGVRRGYRFTTRQFGTARLLVRPASTVWHASGYAINLAGAESLATNLYPVWMVADNWYRFKEKGLIRLLALSPPPVQRSVLHESSNIRPKNATHRIRPDKRRKNISERCRRIMYDLARPFVTRKLKKPM